MTTQAMKEDIEEEEIEQDQYLVFTSRSQDFGIQAMRIQEISAPLSITKVPNTPPYIEGIINLRGRLVSVMDFRKKFMFEPKEQDEDTRIIMVEYGSYPIGIIVDSAEEVIKIPNEKVQKLPEVITTSVSQECITGVGMPDNKRLVILLDADKVLTPTDLAELDATREAMEKVKTIKKSDTQNKKTDAEQQPDTEK
ncbi:MAG: chemotaxis protein CheW [Desulfobacterales bacterium]|nr:chemotaxis protein CheW [Desulfobacterales bacterium]